MLPAGLDAAAILASLQSLVSSSYHGALANAAVPKASAPPPPQQHELWEEFQRYLAAQTLIKNAYGCRADSTIASIASDLVLLDTGSTFHFTGKVGEGGIVDAPPVNVTTAAGEEAFDNGETTIENSQVGTLKAKYAPGALSAAGMGKL